MREKYRKSGSMSPNEMALLYNDLYGTLLAAVHSALNDIVDGAAARPRQPPPEPVPDRARLGQLLELAAQAEALGDTHRAEALHQRRLVAKLDPQVRAAMQHAEISLHRPDTDKINVTKEARECIDRSCVGCVAASHKLPWGGTLASHQSRLLYMTRRCSWWS